MKNGEMKPEQNLICRSFMLDDIVGVSVFYLNLSFFKHIKANYLNQ